MEKPSNVFFDFLKKLFRRDLSPRQDPSNASTGTCYQDEYYNFVYNNSFGENICHLFVDYPNETTTFDYMPVRYAIQVQITNYAIADRT